MVRALGLTCLSPIVNRSALTPSAPATGSTNPRADGPPVSFHQWQTTLPPTQANRRARPRHHQTSPRLPSVSPAWPRKGQSRMVVSQHQLQPQTALRPRYEPGKSLKKNAHRANNQKNAKTVPPRSVLTTPPPHQNFQITPSSKTPKLGV